MARSLSPLAVHALMEQVRECLCGALGQAVEDVPGHPGCPCRTCLVPGTPAWEDCADPCTGETGGQLTVHLEQMWPSTDFPRRDQEPHGIRGCPPPPPTTAAELVVTLLRCAPISDSDCPPPCEELEAAARVLHVDAAVVQSSLVCCLPHTGGGRRGRRYVLGAGRAVGPQGGCVGWEQRVTVALPGCAPCPEGEASP